MLLPPALVTVLDRVTAIVMTLVDAIAPNALADSTPAFPNHAAKTLFFRLAHLVATLIRISNFGIRTPAKPAATPDRAHPTPTARHSGPGSTPALTLPRHPGWLLAALPDMAPTVAADLAAHLADPAFASLLAAAPTLRRTLQPLLRALGLIQPSPSCEASVPRPAAPSYQSPPPVPEMRPDPSPPSPCLIEPPLSA